MHVCCRTSVVYGLRNHIVRLCQQPLCRRYFKVSVRSFMYILNRKRNLIGVTVLSGCGASWYVNGSPAIFAKDLSDNEIIKEADNLYTSENDPRQLYTFLIKHRPGHMHSADRCIVKAVSQVPCIALEGQMGFPCPSTTPGLVKTGIAYGMCYRYRDSTNSHVLWRISRAARDLMLTGTDVSSDEKKALAYEAFEMAKKGLEIDDQNWGCHKWFGITLGDVGDYEGTKIKISNAYVIKEHLERALELNPKDATTAHCIGVWCKVFAELPWYQQKIASLLFAAPPTSTYEEAIKMFQHAENIDPNFYSVNLLELGYCYKMIGDTKRAMLYLDKASKYPAATEEDKETVEKAAELLKKLISKNKS